MPMAPNTKPASVRIDHCICKDISFRELLDLAKTLGPEVDLIALSTGASIQCGKCRPWLECALATGRSCFSPRLDGVDDTDILIQYIEMGSCGAAP
jgi:bacterioferritin-associated ferredoxin